MSGLVLDTHALIWLVEGANRLGPQTQQTIDQAVLARDLWVSAISFWEIALLVKKGRLQLTSSPANWRASVLSLQIREVPLTGEIGILAVNLNPFHPDPADRFITTTALIKNATLVTADRQILGWTGTLKRHDATR